MIELVAINITNLTDARYFAARGAKYIFYKVTSIADIPKINSLQEWISGPELGIELDPGLNRDERDKIINAIKSRRNIFVSNNLMQIYHHEKMWPELMEAISSYGTDFYILDEYCDVLIQYDKDAVVKMYTQRIRAFLETHIARKYYKVAALFFMLTGT